MAKRVLPSAMTLAASRGVGGVDISFQRGLGFASFLFSDFKFRVQGLGLGFRI